MGCRAPQMRQPKRGLGAQPAVAVAVAVEAVRTPATPVVARSASSVRRAGVRPVVRRTSGVHTSRCPHVPVSTRPVSTRLVRSGCPDGHASGVRGLRPRCPKRWMLECVGVVGSLRWAQLVRRAAVGPRAAWSPARVGPARTDGRGLALRARMRVEGRQRPGCGPRSPPGRPRELVPCQAAGRLAGEHEWDQVLTNPPEVSWVRVPAWTSRHGRHRTNTNTTTTERGHPPGPAQLRRAHRVRRGAGCGRSAAAVREERCTPAAGSALTSENSGGRDRV